MAYIYGTHSSSNLLFLRNQFSTIWRCLPPLYTNIICFSTHYTDSSSPLSSLLPSSVHPSINYPLISLTVCSVHRAFPSPRPPFKKVSLRAPTWPRPLNTYCSIGERERRGGAGKKGWWQGDSSFTAIFIAHLVKRPFKETDGIATSERGTLSSDVNRTIQ